MDKNKNLDSHNFIIDILNSFNNAVSIPTKLEINKIVKYLECIEEKKNTAKVLKIDSKIIFDKKQINIYKDKFLKIETIDDFTTLINEINSIRYVDSEPLEKKKLTYYAFINKNKYLEFEINKKDGTSRKISAPINPLKNLLSTINIILHCIYTPPRACHGFTKNKSIVTNAKNHVGKNYVYNTDLENFFTNIHQARIWKRFQSKPFNLNKELANLLSGLVCQQDKNRGFLPQGAPTSPTISNIICERLDKKLINLSMKFNAKYTRYADDLTFSSNKNIYKKDSFFIKELEKIIESENFKINRKKERLQKRGYRQEVTGLIVNEKVNLRRKFIKELRFDIHLIEKYGIKEAGLLFKERTKKEARNFIKIILGRLNYMKMVKGENNCSYLKLKNRFNLCINPNKKIVTTLKTNNFGLTNQAKIIHSPKKLVSILSEFSRNNILKYTTHDWDFDEDNKKDYITFIKNVEEEWERLNNELQKILPKLSAKIYTFLLEKDLDIDKKYWGMHKVAFGWSSLNLKNWALQGKLPFDYFLEEKFRMRIDNKSIDRFSDVVELFKTEIEIRNENKQLRKLFKKLKKEHLPNDFSLKFIDIDNISFYTDVQWFTKGLFYIFKEISRRTTHKVLEIKALKNVDKRFIEIFIIHERSIPNKTVDEMKYEIEDGHFQDIYMYFNSLCDWSIEAKFEDGNYKIDYLSDISPEIMITELDIEPKGFTHILRFYK